MRPCPLLLRHDVTPRSAVCDEVVLATDWRSRLGSGGGRSESRGRLWEATHATTMTTTTTTTTNKQALSQQELVRTRTWRRTTHQTARKVQNKRNKRSVSLSTSCGYIQSRKKERGHREELHVVGERETRGSEHRVDEGCKGESIHQLIFRVVLPDFTQVSG